jgi:hypothetical protein
VAFHKGHGTDDITLTIMAIREDAIEFAKMLGIIGEDEEKFSARVADTSPATTRGTNAGDPEKAWGWF